MWSESAWGVAHGLFLLWVACSLVLLTLLYLLGKYRVGDGRGVLMDSRNKISLSRLQLVGWTLIVLSAMFAWVLGKGTLNLHLPDELLALLGISVTSTAGAITVKAVNASRDMGDTRIQRINAATGAPDPSGEPVKHVGRLVVNSQPNEAKWTDIFMTENPSEAGRIDLGKVQLFGFTILIWTGYLLLLSRGGFVEVAEKTGVLGFPPIDGTIVTLIGLSHAGYLAVKALPAAGTANP